MRIYPLAPAGQLSLVRDVGQIALKSAPKLVQEHLSGAARKALDRGAGAYSSLLAVSKSMVRRPNLSS